MKFRWLVALLLTAGAFPALAQTAGVLDSILNQSAAFTNTWIDRAIDLAKKVFGALVVIEFVWFAMQTTLKKSEISELVGSLAFKVVAIGFFFTLIHFAPAWIPAIQASFLQAGANISGLSLDTFTPSRIIDLGVQAGVKLLDRIEIGIFGSGLLTAIVLAVTAFIVIIAFAILAMQFLVTMLESYIVIGAGALMLGFSGSRWTMNFAEKYLGYAMSVGAKLITVTVLVGFGDSFATGVVDHWEGMRNTTGSGQVAFSDYLSIAGGSLIFAAMSYMLPGLAGSMLNGVASMSLVNTAGAASSATMPAVTNTARAGGLAAAGAAGLLARAATIAAPAGAIAGVARGAAGGGGGSEGGGALGGLVRSAFAGGGQAARGGSGSGSGSGASGGRGSSASAGTTPSTSAASATPGGVTTSGGQEGASGALPTGGNDPASRAAGTAPSSATTPPRGGESNLGGLVAAAARGAAQTLRGEQAGQPGASKADPAPDGGEALRKIADATIASAPPAADPTAQGGSSSTGAGFENPRTPEPPRQDFRAAAQPPRDAGWRDYRDEERERERERRARASAGKLSRILLKAADKSQNSADALSAFARRNRRPLQSDGHTGGSPGIRMRIDD